MGFLNAVIDRIDCSSIKSEEKELLKDFLTKLDADLIAGQYDPTPDFIRASKNLDEYLFDLETEVEDEEEEDNEDDDLAADEEDVEIVVELEDDAHIDEEDEEVKQ